MKDTKIPEFRKITLPDGSVRLETYREVLWRDGRESGSLIHLTVFLICIGWDWFMEKTRPYRIHIASSNRALPTVIAAIAICVLLFPPWTQTQVFLYSHVPAVTKSIGYFPIWNPPTGATVAFGYSIDIARLFSELTILALLTVLYFAVYKRR